MATVSEIDDKLDELKRQAAALKEQRKVAAAKEREQARKWKTATLTAIGESVLKSLDVDWTAIDLYGLREWLDGNAGDIRLIAVTEPRTPVEAKEALDAFKRSAKTAKTGATPTGEAREPEGEQSTEAPEGGSDADAGQPAQPDW